MRLERYTETSVSPREQKPARTSEILARFGFEPEKNPAEKVNLSLFEASLLNSVLNKNSLPFDRNRKECPFNNLVMAGSLLVGQTNPKQIDRVNQIFCGTTIEYEDSEGPLSGRRGNVYEPLSHC